MALPMSVVTLIPLLASTLGLAPAAQQGQAGAIGWLRSQARELVTVEPGGPDADLRPITAVVADARLVALGEEVHGVGSFVKLKRRVIEHLFSEGFTALVLEEQFGVGLELDAAIRAAEAEVTFDRLGVTWHLASSETLALLRWMQMYNADPGQDRELRVFGVDCQTVFFCVERVRAYLQEVSGSLTDAEGELLTSVRNNPFGLARKTAAERREVREAMQALERQFADRREEWIGRSSPQSWEISRQAMRNVVQCVTYHDLLANDPVASYALRDQFMAENLMWILEHLGDAARVVFDAHNVHISKEPYEVVYDAESGSAVSTGSRMAEELGEQYRCIGIYRNQGTLYLPPAGLHKVGPAPAGTLNAALADVGFPRFFVSFPAEVPSWLRQPQPQSFGFPVGSSIAPALHFDGLLFVDTTEAITPLWQ